MTGVTYLISLVIGGIHFKGNIIVGLFLHFLWHTEAKNDYFMMNNTLANQKYPVLKVLILNVILSIVDRGSVTYRNRFEESF